MERPCVRYLDVQPYGDKFVINDPFGLSEPMLVTKELLFIMSLMDGTRTEEDIKVEFLRRTGTILSSEDYRKVLKILEENYLLLEENFLKKLEEKKRKMLKKRKKEPFHAGEAYPKDPKELKKFIESSLDGSTKESPTGILVPHMDIRIALETYGKVYGRVEGDPQTVVILGVSHYIHEMPMSVCPLDFETPLGTLHVDNELIERLKTMFEYNLFHDILSYEREHSIEFQTIFIKYLFPKAKVLPIIVSYGDESSLKEIGDKISEALKDRDLLIISSVDMSHVGRKFGDPYSYDPSFRDKKYIKYLEELDNISAFNLLKSDENRTRIDGQFTNFVFIEILKNLGVKQGKEIDYKIHHEDFTDSKVSYAGMTFS